MSVRIQKIVEYTIHSRVLVCLLCVLFAAGMYAENYIRVSADFSYAHDMSRTKADASAMKDMPLADALQIVGCGIAEPYTGSNGLAPAVGVGYRYIHNLLMVDAGLGLEYRYTVNKLYDVVDATAPAVDDTGLDYTGYHTWSKREAKWQHVGVHVPVMIGIRWKWIYAMAGMKANVDVWSSSKENGAYSLRGRYDMFMDPIYMVEGHGFVSNEPYTMKAVSASMAWNMRACAEIGYCFNVQTGRNNFKQKNDPRYYIGAFAEYTFAGTKETYWPLLAGVKVTALIPLPEKHHCNCYGYW